MKSKVEFYKAFFEESKKEKEKISIFLKKNIQSALPISIIPGLCGGYSF